MQLNAWMMRVLKFEQILCMRWLQSVAPIAIISDVIYNSIALTDMRSCELTLNLFFFHDDNIKPMRHA
jgi:hypothetical protein